MPRWSWPANWRTRPDKAAPKQPGQALVVVDPLMLSRDSRVGPAKERIRR